MVILGNVQVKMNNSKSIVDRCIVQDGYSFENLLNDIDMYVFSMNIDINLNENMFVHKMNLSFVRIEYRDGISLKSKDFHSKISIDNFLM